MKLIKISNRGSLNRKYLELIGFGTKRGSVDDASVIGNKGSGTKLAAVAALRLNLGAAIASTDCYGSYLLTFDLENIKVEGVIAKQIYRCFENRRAQKVESLRYPSEMVLEAFQDWDRTIGSDDKTQFKVLREFVCNALDADKSFRIEVVSRIEHALAGETSVYLRFSDQIRDMLFEPEIVPRYFKFWRHHEPVFSLPAIGDIYPKSEPGKSRLFVLGVLVDCSDSWWRRSIFDYSMNLKSLISEERIIRNIYEYMAEIAKLFCQLTHRPIAKNILACVAKGEAEFEGNVLSRIQGITPASKKVWLAVAHELFGEKIAVASGFRVIDEDCRQIYGYMPVGADNNDLRIFLKKIGIPDAKEIVPQKFEYELVSFFALDADSRKRFHEAFRLFATHFPERAGLPIVLYYPLDDAPRRLAGFTPMSGERKFMDIWLATKTKTTFGSVLDIFETLVHESRHCLTKVDDYDRRFVRQAERDIAYVVFRGEGLAAFDDGTAIPPAGVSGAVQPYLLMPEEIAKSPCAAGGIPVATDPDAIDAQLEELLAKIGRAAEEGKK